MTSVHDIFICYRRGGGNEVARTLKASLEALKWSVFLDVDDLRAGRFDQKLLTKISTATNFLVILSPKCLDRCKDPNDWLRLEIEHALATKRNIIPVLLPRFKYPNLLDDPISELTKLQSVLYSHEYFGATLKKLGEFLGRNTHKGDSPTEFRAAFATGTSAPRLNFKRESHLVGTLQEIQTFVGHRDDVHGLVVSRDGRWAISASYDKTLKVWDVSNGGELRALIGHQSWVNSVALDAAARLAISASGDGTLRVWDLKGGGELGCVEEHSGSAMGLSRDLLVMSGGSGSVFGVALDRDGQLAISASGDKMLRSWKLKQTHRKLSLRKLNTFSGHNGSVRGVALSHDGRIAISASADRTLKVWDTATGTERLNLGGHEGIVHSVALCSDEQLAVSASEDNTVRVWDVEKGRAKNTLVGHEDQVMGVTLSKDARIAVSVSCDKTLRVWDIASGVEQARFSAAYTLSCVALHPDGKTILCGGKGTVVHVLGWQ